MYYLMEKYIIIQMIMKLLVMKLEQVNISKKLNVILIDMLNLIKT